MSSPVEPGFSLKWVRFWWGMIWLSVVGIVVPFLLALFDLIRLLGQITGYEALVRGPSMALSLVDELSLVGLYIHHLVIMVCFLALLIVSWISLWLMRRRWQKLPQDGARPL